jgi:hypothetical protein
MRCVASAAGDVLGLANDNLNHFGENALCSTGLLLMLDRHRPPKDSQENERADPEHGKGESGNTEDDGERERGYLPEAGAPAAMPDLIRSSDIVRGGGRPGPPPLYEAAVGIARW